MPYIRQIETYKPKNEEQRKNKEVILKYIEIFGDEALKRSSEIAHLSSSGFILNPSLTKTLMVHHNIYNTWAWTGGHADGDRDMLEIAIKEAKEETGVKGIKPLNTEIVSLDILPVCAHIKNGTYVNAHMHLSISYVLIADENETLRINEAENSGVMWIDTNKMDEFCKEPDMVELYKRLCARAHEMI